MRTSKDFIVALMAMTNAKLRTPYSSSFEGPKKLFSILVFYIDVEPYLNVKRQKIMG